MPRTAQKWKRLTSECGRYTAERQSGGAGARFTLFDAGTGERLGETTYWSNRSTGSRDRFECGFGDTRMTFSYPCHPSWFYRRWVECWDIDCAGVAELVRGCGAEVLVAFKPGMNCWHHVGFRATPGVARQVDRELKRRKLGFVSRQGRGHFGIGCPLSARGL